MQRNALSPRRLAEDLRALGLLPGDLVYVHSSLKQVGWIEGGPPALIEAFLSVLGPGGTLAVPTHTLSFVGLGRPPYDPASTPSLLGAFSDAVWRHPGARRSGHGSHSSAAVGPQAEALTADHDPTDALGEASPLYRLYRRGGKVLLLGVGHNTNTLLHLGEALSGAGYHRLPYDASWGKDVHVVQGGEVRSYPQRFFPGCSAGFPRIEPLLPQGAEQMGMVGNAHARLVDAASLVDTAVAVLRKQPGFFLCDASDCPCCPARKAFLTPEEGA